LQGNVKTGEEVADLAAAHWSAAAEHTLLDHRVGEGFRARQEAASMGSIAHLELQMSALCINIAEHINIADNVNT
jgi:hypothetical protein